MSLLPVLRAIPTNYRDYAFRSRVEAHWAVFLDSLSLVWTYESEGYDLGRDGWYLPDFWLPTIGCWLEIKGAAPNRVDSRKAVALADAAGCPVVLFHGEIDARMIGGIATNGYYPDSYIWAGCTVCGQVDIIDRGACNMVNCPTCRTSRIYRVNTPALRSAFRAARAARFEFGEKP